MKPRILARFPGLAAVALALVVPVLLATQLVRAAGDPGGALGSGLLQRVPLLAQTDGPAAAPGAGATGVATSPGLATGVLYVRGEAVVTWNGSSFPVRNGSYAYAGGERIAVASGGMGLLRLPDGSTVFLCPDSRSVLTREASGAYRLQVERGASRFAFRAGSDFLVLAGGAEIRPQVRDPAASHAEGEVLARPGGGCLLCELQRGLQVSAAGVTDAATGVAPGRVVEVTPVPDGSGRFTVAASAIAPALMVAVLGPGRTAEPGAAYLCRCEALRREAQEAVRSEPSQAQGQPQGEPQPAAPATTQAEVAPPVLPPDAPPVAMAEPAAPDPFDPNVLPPPAAGEPAEPVVVVAPPAVPRSGTGGGGSSRAGDGVTVVASPS